MKGHFESLGERRKFVAEEYEHLWDGVREKAAAAIAAGERDLHRLHLATRRVFGAEFSDDSLARKYKAHEARKRASGIILDRQLLQVDDLETQTLSLVTDAVKMREVLRAMGDGVERVVETGAGWAKTLMNLWLYGGPRDAEYWALEPTHAGRAVTDMILRAAAARPALRTAAFDYYEPDFSMLQGTKRTALVTHHSIEQVPELSQTYLDAVLAIPGFTRCVHLEPVGWQVPGQAWLHGPPERMDELDRQNERFSRARDQNHNLYALLRDNERRGRITLHVVRKHLCSHQLDNATTLIAWGPADGSPVDASRRDDLAPPRASAAGRLRPAVKRLLARLLGGR